MLRRIEIRRIVVILLSPLALFTLAAVGKEVLETELAPVYLLLSVFFAFAVMLSFKISTAEFYTGVFMLICVYFLVREPVRVVMVFVFDRVLV